MGVARRRWSPDEKRTVLKLAKEGWTHKQIAEKLRPGVATAWRSVGEIIRDERNKTTSNTVTAPAAKSSTPTKVTRSSGYTSKVELPDNMADSLSAKEFMTMMDDDQRAIFVATYEDLRGNADEDALTRAENEMLIRASFSNVKYLRAQSLLHIAETYLMADIEGALSDSDEDEAKRRFGGGRETYKKEVEQWHKEYMELLNDLKLTRKQRLDKIKDTRNTFLDLQQELVNRDRQGSIIEDIKRINRATDDEFHRMAKGHVGPDGRSHSWLIGAFDEYLQAPEEDTTAEATSEEKEDGDGST
jgi:transposase-like protein